MAANTSPIFSIASDFQSGGTFTLAANDYTGQNINNNVIFAAGETNGGFIQRLRLKALGTNVATVLRLYVNNGLLRLISPIAAVTGTPTGTPSASGGTLRAGNFFAKVVAVDQYGGQTTASTETASVAVTGNTGSITWNWTAVTGAVSYKIYVGPVTGGQASYFTATTNSFVQVDPIGQRDSLNSSILNNFFYGEIPLPATTGIATTATVDIDYPMGLALPPSYRLIGGLGTAVASGWHITAIAGKY